MSSRHVCTYCPKLKVCDWSPLEICKREKEESMSHPVPTHDHESELPEDNFDCDDEHDARAWMDAQDQIQAQRESGEEDV